MRFSARGARLFDRRRWPRRRADGTHGVAIFGLNLDVIAVEAVSSTDPTLEATTLAYAADHGLYES